jgi:hypothetical protein
MAQYADIVAVNAPANAVLGDSVAVEVDVENLHSSVISLKVVGIAYYTVTGVGLVPFSLTFQPSYASPNPGTAFRFSAFFTMPTNTKMTIYLTSQWYGSDGQWHGDDAATVEINAAGAVEGFSEFKISAVSKV